MSLTPTTLTVLSIGLLALALLAFAGALVAGELRRARASALIRRAIRSSAASIAEGTIGQAAAAKAAQEAEDAEDNTPAAELPLHWLESRLGKALVGEEDRRLIEKCGYSTLRPQLYFFVARIALAILVPLAAWAYMEAGGSPPNIFVLCGAFFIGFMGPKWLLRRRASQRRARIDHELPLFVDLLRLLQGVGLSLDQTLHIMAEEFGNVLPVLAQELALANRQYAQGRSREHSLNRLGNLYESEQLSGLVSLLVQVDRHGGAVQEPLRMFSDRLREHRRSEMKEKIGKITVKMTVIMICTLLPALIIVTAGPGFLAVMRSVGSMSR